ncbi:DUF4157 domain-containing protein [Nocardioides litoris]|uniref:eCIS core domain-containing protein n=1 Tax=Nocardioides litoris TaxID=1926648 RepID=UPI00111D343E|nr:DUF4157 domain-containing protein [Nocardioides litoris]
MSRRAYAHHQSADGDLEVEHASTPAPVRRTAAPLVVGAADDRAEVEADRVADQVISRLQGGEAGETHVHDGCHGIARTAAPSTSGAPEVGYAGGEISDGLTSRIEARRGSGSALPDGVRQRMESGFGRSLADVRVHTDGEAATLNRSVSARAFTTGKDIFFGAGEFRPDTPAGEKVLAHEIAHTQQQGGGARRLHRWAFGGKLEFDKTKSVGVVGSGQAVFFLDDTSGDRLVIKDENKETGLANLSGVALEGMGGVKSVRQRKLSAEEAQKVSSLILSKGGGKLDKKAWAKLGAEMRADNGGRDQVNMALGRPADASLDEFSDIEVAQFYHQNNIGDGSNLVAQNYAGADTGIKTAKSADPDQMKPQENRFRALLSDYKHMEGLGRLTAIDLFLGNADRVLGGNIGNWIYDPWSTAITVIDNVDRDVSENFKGGKSAQDFERYLSELKSSELGQTASQCARRLLIGLEARGGDKGAMAWAEADGGWRKEMMAEALERGLVEGRKTIIKTFSATRFSLGSSGKKARSVKKSIKAASREAAVLDGASPEDYYAMLKERAKWLKTN